MQLSTFLLLTLQLSTPTSPVFEIDPSDPRLCLLATAGDFKGKIFTGTHQCSVEVVDDRVCPEKFALRVRSCGVGSVKFARRKFSGPDGATELTVQWREPECVHTLRWKRLTGPGLDLADGNTLSRLYARKGLELKEYSITEFNKISREDIAGAKLWSKAGGKICKAEIMSPEARIQDFDDVLLNAKFAYYQQKWEKKKCDEIHPQNPARRHRCKRLNDRIRELRDAVPPGPQPPYLREAARELDTAAQERIDALPKSSGAATAAANGAAVAPNGAAAAPNGAAAAANGAAAAPNGAAATANGAAAAPNGAAAAANGAAATANGSTAAARNVDPADLRALANAAMLLALEDSKNNNRKSGPSPLAQKAIQTEQAARDAEETAQKAMQDAESAARGLAAHAAKRAAEEALRAVERVEQATGIERGVLEIAALRALDRAKNAAAIADRNDASSKPKPAQDESEGKDSKDKKVDKGEDKSDTEKDLDRLKAGKLIAWGVTAGVSAAFFQPMTPLEGRHALPGMGALTYLMLLPAYWRNTPETNIYCANKWGGRTSEAAAARAADDISAERAQLIVDRLLDHARAGGLRPGDATAVMCTNQRCAGDEHRIRELTETALGSDESAKAARRLLVAHVQRSTYGWKSGITTSCAGRRVGIWFGYPLKFTATLPYRAEMQVRRERMDVTPLFAGGFGWSPNAYVSLLAGISLGKVNLPPGTDRDDEFVASFVFGLGGNLDLVKLFTK